ncbi:carboxylesterase [Chloropicon primus]|nr:carboxylesterase [Chloropicon primus]
MRIVTFALALATAVACCVVGASAASAQDGDLIVKTTAGPVQGFRSGNLSAFLGIPFASAGRWEMPQDPKPWIEPLRATRYGPICPQANGSTDQVDSTTEVYWAEEPWNIVMPPPSEQSEDCLRVNVYVPDDVDDAAGAPVMVWIHGGAFLNGNGNGFASPPETLVGKGVVLVTFNYRLGALGFFAHPDLKDDTNFGLFDQIAALRWVQENIEQFGGDPSKVTIFGQSAGGAAVEILMVSPLTKNLFHRAIVESGSIMQSQNVTVDDAKWIGVAVGEAMGVEAGPSQLEKMRDAPFADIVSATLQSMQHGVLPDVVFIDGKSMDTDATTGFLEGRNHKVPMIIGTNQNETNVWYGDSSYAGGFPLPMLQLTPELSAYVPPTSKVNYENIIRKVYKGSANEILSLYPADQPLESSERMQTNMQFLTGTLMIANAMAGRGEDVRLYQFTQKPEGAAGEKFGTYHGYELPYVFGSASARAQAPITNPALADQMSSYWSNFARVGDPNAEGLPEWKTLPSASANEWFILGPEVGTESIPKDVLEQNAASRSIFLQYLDIPKLMSEFQS